MTIPNDEAARALALGAKLEKIIAEAKEIDAKAHASFSEECWGRTPSIEERLAFLERRVGFAFAFISRVATAVGERP